MPELSTSLDTTHRWQAAEHRRVAYLSKGRGSMQRWNGQTAALEAAGVEGPSQEVGAWAPSPSTASGSMTVGVHVFRYLYLDSRTGFVSNPSNEYEITVASGAQQLTFAISGSGSGNMIRSSDSKVDKIVVEATTAAGTEFYKAAEVLQTASSVAISLSDAALQEQFLAWPEDGHDPPPVAKNVISHRERLWLFGQVVHSTGTVSPTASSTTVSGTGTGWTTSALGTSATARGDVVWFLRVEGDTVAYEISYAASSTSLELVSAYGGSTESGKSYEIFSRANVIWVSRAGYPEAFRPLKFLNGPNGEGSGDLTAGIGYAGSMIFFSLSGMYRVSWDQDPTVDPVITPLSTQRGALSQRVVAEVEGRVYAMDRLGWSMWDGVFPRHLSKPVDDLLDLIDFDKVEEFHVAWHPGVRALRWWVCYTSDDADYPKRYVQLDVDTGAWSTGSSEVAISESRLVYTQDGPKVFYGDENGYTWEADLGTADGVEAAFDHLTVGSGATTTSVPVSEVLTTGEKGLAGCMAYWLEGEESSLVTSSTSSALIVEGFTSAPAAGDTLWIGRIVAKLKTPAFTSKVGPRHVQRPRYLWAFYEPEASARRVRAKIYADLSASARTDYSSFSRSSARGVTPPGAEDSAWGVTRASEQLVQLDNEDGVACVGFGGSYKRAVEVEFVADEPGLDFEIYGLELEGSDVERRPD